jgi:prepilin-type N-terminal cleavage/methylation domain-containing protein
MKTVQGRTRNSGFTLIELLVVIAIIAILASILFPVFAQARESARLTACLSNMKQMGTGLRMYSQDYDENFPLRRAQSPTVIEGNWKHLLQPYIKNLQIFQCPSNQASRVLDETGGTTNPPYAAGLPKTPRGYFMYHAFFKASASPGSADWWAGKPYTEIAFEYPSTTLIIGENKDVFPDYGPWIEFLPTWGAAGANWGAKHRGSDRKINLVFIDGHAKFHDWAQACQAVNGDGTNMWAYNPTNMTYGDVEIGWIDTFCQSYRAYRGQ